MKAMILDAEHRERGILHHRTIAEVDALIARSFCEGLLLQYWLQMTPEHRENPFEAFSRKKRRTRQNGDTPQRPNSANPPSR